MLEGRARLTAGFADFARNRTPPARTEPKLALTLAAYTASDPVHIVETSEEEVTDLGALAGHPGNLHGRIPPAEADRMHDVEDIFAGTLD